jgi:hypothetical protein
MPYPKFVETAPGQFELAPFNPVASADEHLATANLARAAFHRDYAAAQQALIAHDIVRAAELTQACISHKRSMEHYTQRAQEALQKAIDRL